MPLLIPDDVLRQAGVTEREARLEFACRLFEAGKLDLHAAATLAELTRQDFEDALLARGIAVHRPAVDDLRRDVEHLRKAGV